MNDMTWNPSGYATANEAELHAPNREIRLGLMVAGAFFVGLLGWAALTPLDAAAVAEGVVAVSGNRQAVQHREGGVVTALHVVEGQAVRKGDVLLKISTSELVANERALAGEVIGLLAQRARLMAERDGAPGFSAPLEYATLTGTDRKLADDAMRGQQLLFEARSASVSAERSVFNQRARQYSQQIGGLHSQVQSNARQQQLLSDELEGLRSLVSRGFVSTNRIRALERTAAQLEGEAGSLRADIGRSNEAVAEAQLQMVSVSRDRLEEVANQLRDVQLRIEELRPKWTAARERLDQAAIKAPAAGKVVGLHVFTVGGVVSAEETLMEIVPQDRALVVEAKVSAEDADDLRIGMDTQVRFTALKERDMPILHGAIARVSADSFEDQRTGRRYFTMEVRVPPQELAKIREIRADGGLRPGLTAEVLVPLRQRTALGYLIEPLTQTLWKAGREH